MVCFLYTLNVKVSCSCRIVTSRKLILFSVSFSIANLILDVRLLKELKTSCIFVMDSLYTIKISSKYRKYPTMWFCTRMLNIAVLSTCCSKTSEKMEEVGDPIASPFSCMKKEFRN